MGSPQGGVWPAPGTQAPCLLLPCLLHQGTLANLQQTGLSTEGGAAGVESPGALIVFLSLLFVNCIAWETGGRGVPGQLCQIGW